MGNSKLRWRFATQVLLFPAAAVLSSRVALAQMTTPVNGFVVVNPISVCDSSTGLCAPFGMRCTSATGTQVCTVSATPSTATVNTPIGFVDADTNVNLTRAFWAQAGIDVAFFPVQSYKSPVNTIPSSWANIKDATNGSAFTYSATNYQTLHLVNVGCQDGFTALTSPDFQALTQHSICTEHGGLSGTYSKLANPPSAPSGVPLASTLGYGMSNALDVFFVNLYSGTGLSTPQYGFSWINGDGVSIGKAALSAAQPRFDTLGHEIGHALALDHTTFGAGDVGDMMTTGSNRGTSAKSGCQVTTSTPPVFNGGALFNLDYTSSAFNPCMYYTTPPQIPLDQLISGTCTDLTTCTNQEGAAALSPFINKTLASTANAGGGSQTPVASTATTSTTSPSGAFPFTVSATPQTGNTGDAINSIIIALPTTSPLSFNGSSPATFVSCTDQNGSQCTVTIINQARLNGNNGFGNPNCMKTINLAPPNAQCLQIYFSTGFTAGINVQFTIAFNKDPTTLLAGTQYSVITAAGYATTSLFSGSNGVFRADSQNPDLTVPNLIDTNFVSASVTKLGPKLSKCTPPLAGLAYPVVKINGRNVQVCPDEELSSGWD